jgi:acetylornithine deacetylase/succinyl-diaminopimelate desuccinylase-like protein
MNNYKADIIKFIQKLVSIPSVNGINNEVKIINAIKEEADKLKLSNQTLFKDPLHPNIFVGNNFDKKEGLLLIAHVDTAGVGDETKWQHKPFGGEIENGKLFGRGAIDNKAGIALSIYTLKTLMDQGKLDSAKFIGVSDEECGADSIFGARYLLDQGLNAKSAIYTYSGNDVITIGHRGQVKLWVSVTGESAHSGSSSWQNGTRGASAIDALNKFISEVNKFEIEGIHEAFPNYTFKQTILFIEGGSKTSLVPDKARCLIDARLLPIHENNKYIEVSQKLQNHLKLKKLNLI